MRILAGFLGLMLSGVVCAAPTAPVIDKEGFVRVEMDVGHSPGKVRSYLSDAERTMRLGQEIREVDTIQEGECTLMKVTTHGFGQTMHFLSRRCPTLDGWQSTMLESPDFERHDIEWTVSPSESGSHVMMRVRIIPRIPVPQFVIRKIVGGALVDTLNRLKRVLE